MIVTLVKISRILTDKNSVSSPSELSLPQLTIGLLSATMDDLLNAKLS